MPSKRPKKFIRKSNVPLFRNKHFVQRYVKGLPMLESAIRFKHTFRFQQNSGSFARTSFTRAQLIQIWSFNISTTVNQPILGAIKILKMDIYGPTAPDSSGSAVDNSISAVWQGALGPNSQGTITTNSVGDTPVLTTRPPPGSAAATWTNIFAVNANLTGTNFNEGAEVLFDLAAPPGTYVDLLCDCICNDTPTTTSITTTALTAGTPVFQSLDNIGLSGASHIWDPIGVRQRTS